MIQTIKKVIKDYFVKNNTIPDVRQSFTRLKELGVNPTNVFDIGAYHGYFSKLIFKIWPEANVFCFEGNPLKQQIIEKNLSSYKSSIKIFSYLLGEDDNNNVSFNIQETASSVLNEHHNQGFDKINVPMRSLKSLIDEKTIPIPSLLKIDTQGYEFEILLGLGYYIKQVEYILLESNFLDIHKNVHLVADIVKYLNEFEFVMYDITEIHRRPLDNAIFQVDYIFVKKDSFLRQNKSWK
ncbi:MAG: FkbM family methyltransferase [Bacteroidales bacterium]|nr:FkbM family methyltransferase [Bacteroidales bacterium]